MDCPNNLQQEHIADIAEIKTTIKEHERKIDKLDEISEAVIGIKLFLDFFKQDAAQREKQRIIDSEKRDLVVQKQSNVLEKISINLANLNLKVEKTQINLQDLETIVETLQVQYVCSENKNIIKIDTREIVKSICKKVLLPTGVGLAVLALIYEILKVFKVF